MSSFSERMGFSKPPEFMQLDGMTDSLSNLLCNFCCRILIKIPRLWEVENGISDLLGRLSGSFRFVEQSLYNSYFEDLLFKKCFQGLDFHQKYSVVEYIVRTSGRDAHCQELNQILVRENSGYRLNENCQLVPISNQEELDEVSEAQHSKIDLVALHMNKAVACFADREKPDYDNSIKESVSALEALAQKLSGEKGTLGALIKKLELHPSLKESVSKLYGYASDGGIRHAKKDGDPEVDFDTAKFVIVTSSALINFITAKCTND